MKKNKFKYDFLVFLYAYFRQADLSLDRSRWDSLNSLREYYRGKISPRNVYDYLIHHSGFNPESVKTIAFIREMNFFERMNYFMLRLFHANSFLTDDEIHYCCQKLLVIEEYLKNDTEPHKLETEKLRIEIVKFVYGVLEYKLYIKDRKKAMHVEHYLQNALKTIPIKEFMKGFSI